MDLRNEVSKENFRVTSFMAATISATNKTNINNILNMLTNIESKEKLDRSTCNCVIDIWNLLANTIVTQIPNFQNTFKKIFKFAAKTILSGIWPKLQNTIHLKFKENVLRVSNHFGSSIYSKELRQCRSLLSLIDTNPWLKQNFRSIISPVSEENSISSMCSLWEEEGWLIIKSRLEKLVDFPSHLTLFSEACVREIRRQLLTGYSSQFNSKDEQTEMLYQLLAIFGLSITQTEGEKIGAERLQIYLATPLTALLDLLNLLTNQKDSRILSNWIGWKKDLELAIEIIEFGIIKPSRPPINSCDIKHDFMIHIFCTWLKTLQTDGAEERRIACSPSKTLEGFKVKKAGFELNDLNLSDQGLNQILSNKKFDEIMGKVEKSDWVYRYADYLADFYKTSRTAFKKCIQLYLNRMILDSSVFKNGQEDLNSEERNDLLKSLYNAFESLTKYFKFHPQIHFEILVTKFSMNPSKELLSVLRTLATDPTSGVDVTKHLGNEHNQTLSLPASLYTDLSNVIPAPRVNRFTTIRESWNAFEVICEQHLSTRGSDIIHHNQLSLVKPTDFTPYANLRSAYDNDSCGYEIGYLPQDNSFGSLNDENERRHIKIREPKQRMAYYVKNNGPISNSYCRRKRGKVPGESSYNLIRTKQNDSKKRKLPSLNSSPSKNEVIDIIKQDSPEPNEDVHSPVRRKSARNKGKTYKSIVKDMFEEASMDEDSCDSDDVYSEPLQKCRRRSKEHVSASMNHSLSQLYPSRYVYKPNDFNLTTIIQNQKICQLENTTAIWPPILFNNVKNLFPVFQEIFPSKDSELTYSCYHTSTTISHVGRLGKTITPEDVKKMSSKFLTVEESVNNLKLKQVPFTYDKNSTAWSNYFNNNLRVIQSRSRKHLRKSNHLDSSIKIKTEVDEIKDSEKIPLTENTKEIICTNDTSEKESENFTTKFREVRVILERIPIENLNSSQAESIEEEVNSCPPSPSPSVEILIKNIVDEVVNELEEQNQRSSPVSPASPSVSTSASTITWTMEESVEIDSSLDDKLQFYAVQPFLINGHDLNGSEYDESEPPKLIRISPLNNSSAEDFNFPDNPPSPLPCYKNELIQ